MPKKNPAKAYDSYEVITQEDPETGDMLISLAAMPIKAKGMVNTLRVTEITSCSF